MTDARDTARAQQIARDEQGSDPNGYLSWEDNHSCGFGCCGGGKEINRFALAAAIQRALSEVRAETRAETLANAHNKRDVRPAPERRDEHETPQHSVLGGDDESRQDASAEGRVTAQDAIARGAAAVSEVPATDGHKAGASGCLHDGADLPMVRGVIAAETRTPHGWQPLDEDQPPPSGSVLVSVDGMVGEARFHEGEGWYWENIAPSDSHGSRIYPQFFMPLPPPPDEGPTP